MEKKHIITIAGSLGSGKSSTANKVAEILGYTRASTGDFMRAIADKRGVTLAELSVMAEKDNGAIDNELDDHNREVGEKNNIVLDSRLGFFFVPKSYKVFLDLESNIAAQRILKDAEKNPNRGKETREGFDTVEGIVKSINERFDSEKKRYKELYGIENHRAPENFDLVINTATMPLEAVAEKIVEEYNNWLNE